MAELPPTKSLLLKQPDTVIEPAPDSCKILPSALRYFLPREYSFAEIDPTFDWD